MCLRGAERRPDSPQRRPRLTLNDPDQRLQSNFDLVARIPLVVHIPWLPGSHGKRTSALVEAVDLMPTVLEALGLHSQERVHDLAQLEGTSFMPLLREPSTAPEVRADGGKRALRRSALQPSVLA